MNQELPPSDPSQNTDDKEVRAKSRDPLVGTVLDGRFQIEDVLGSGGMSVVYKATQLRVNRHVAIKTLRLQLDAKDVYRERFQREISSLCTLSHPNIVTVYDAIIGPDDQPYVVMDYLRGRSLEALIEDEGPMSVERFARISIQICSALEHAHKKGIVHRDLKPGNVVLMDDEMDFVKVVDFGLAKIGDQNRRLTHSGELWGSPPYMSPEQCMGEPQDARSDLYSIGCVMYEMLTGFDPYRTATTVFEFIKFHTSVPPPPMQSANAMVRVPPKVEAVVFKALEKQPSKRYQTAKELQDAIVEASSASVDREKGEFLFHLANQASTKTSSGQQIESNESLITASQAFNMALNPFAGDMLQELAAGQAPQALPQETPVPETAADSFSPSVQRWRTPDSATDQKSEIVQPTGEIVQPAGIVVPPPGVPHGAEVPANFSSPAASLTPPLPQVGQMPASPTGGTAAARANPGSNPAVRSSSPPKISRPGVDAGAPSAANPWLLVILLALAAVAGLIYVLPSLTGHGGGPAKTEAPTVPAAASTPATSSPATSTPATSTSTNPAATQTPASATGEASGNQIKTGPAAQSATGQANNDKAARRDSSKSPDEILPPRARPKHLHGGLKGQTGAKTAHLPSGAAQSGPSPARSTHPANASSPHSSGKADPWSTLEKLR